MRPVAAPPPGCGDQHARVGQTVGLVPPGAAGALAEVLEALRRDPAWGAALARHGNERARRRFSRAAMLDGVDRVIGEVAS
jgi:glycosyltransferase involved in cell wall biosynthesis